MKTISKKSLRKKILIFLIFQFAFFAISFPVLVFYGPFENLKSAVVGMSWKTNNTQYIAKFFLSDKAIDRILNKNFPIDPTVKNGEIKVLKFAKKNTDKIDVFDVNGNGFSGKLMVVYNPMDINIGYSDNMPKSGETVSAIAKQFGAIAAINAGGFIDTKWSGTGGTPTGYIIHNGIVVYGQNKNENIKQDTVAFTDAGMLIVGKHSIKQLMEYKVKEAVSFGPPLIVNGVPTINSGDGGWGYAPRTAIGKRKDGAVLLLVIDGRNIEGPGASLRNIQDILLEHGAINAVNLDGGSSTTMVYNGKVINKPSDMLGERAVPSAFIVLPSNH